MALEGTLGGVEQEGELNAAWAEPHGLGITSIDQQEMCWLLSGGSLLWTTMRRTPIKAP